MGAVSCNAGVYTINYNILSWINYSGGEVKMMVFHNGIELPETEMYSYSDVHAHDMASRTTVGDFCDFCDFCQSTDSLSD